MASVTEFSSWWQWQECLPHCNLLQSCVNDDQYACPSFASTEGRDNWLILFKEKALQQCTFPMHLLLLARHFWPKLTCSKPVLVPWRASSGPSFDWGSWGLDQHTLEHCGLARRWSGTVSPSVGSFQLCHTAWTCWSVRVTLNGPYPLVLSSGQYCSHLCCPLSTVLVIMATTWTHSYQSVTVFGRAPAKFRASRSMHTLNFKLRCKSNITQLGCQCTSCFENSYE